jgi:hypothetical protein
MHGSASGEMHIVAIFVYFIKKENNSLRLNMTSLIVLLFYKFSGTRFTKQGPAENHWDQLQLIPQISLGPGETLIWDQQIIHCSDSTPVAHALITNDYFYTAVLGSKWARVFDLVKISI